MQLKSNPVIGQSRLIPGLAGVVILALGLGAEIAVAAQEDGWRQTVEDSLGWSISGPTRRSDRGSGQETEGDGAGQSGLSGEDAEISGAMGPLNPDVSALVSQWIQVAEPPANATDGASLRYNAWGQFEGTAGNGGTITANAKPDSAAGKDSVEYLWGERGRLDSVDHCTLGEYVESRLAGQSIDRCLARYKPVVPDFIGWPVKDAKRKIDRLRLKAKLKTGSPAPDKASEYKVARQSVGQGTSLPRGSEVELRFYSRYVDQKVLGDFVGRRVAEAKRVLQSQGFDVKFRVGSTPQTQEQASTVERQSPEAGSRVKSGTTVMLTVYPAYVEMVTVPAVTRLPLSEARQRAKSAGLAVQVEQSAKASREEQSNSVFSQSLEPGARVKKGSDILLKAYGLYAKPRFAPNLIGKKYDDPATRKQLRDVGMRSFKVNGPTAGNRQQVGIIAQQSIAPGKQVKFGSTIYLTVYADPEEARRREELRDLLEGKPSWERDKDDKPGGWTETIRPSPPVDQRPLSQFDCELGLAGLGVRTINSPGRSRYAKITAPSGANGYSNAASCYYDVNGRERLLQIAWFSSVPPRSSGVFNNVACKPGFSKSETEQIVGGTRLPMGWARVADTTGKAAFVRFHYLPNARPTELERLGESRYQQMAEKMLEKVRTHSVNCSGVPNSPPKPPAVSIKGTWRWDARCPSGDYYGFLAFSDPHPDGNRRVTFSTVGGGGDMAELSLSSNRISFVRALHGRPKRVQYWSGTLQGDKVTGGTVRESGYPDCSFTLKKR